MVESLKKAKKSQILYPVKKKVKNKLFQNIEVRNMKDTVGTRKLCKRKTTRR